jgi:exodeoxyribonuclease VII large subunit
MQDIGIKIYTVTELTREIKGLLKLKYAAVWVEGEIWDFKHHSSGHMYFTLKDEFSQLRAAMFKNVNQYLKFTPENGLHVIAQGYIDVFERKGEYQLVVEYLEPVGIGALQLAFEQLKQKLEKEGLFDKSRKRPIPKFPENIGIITSPVGAAIKDILNIINRRFPHVKITIYPVKVQGEEAAGEIVKAIKEMNEIGKFDVLILARGGGSLADLWAFNEEIVARAIFESKIPIISAIGHEIDYTISDFVSDLRAPTPSAAAELVVPNQKEVEEQILNYIARIGNGIKGILTQSMQELDTLKERLNLSMHHIIEIEKKNIGLIFSKLEALNPFSILKRGYSIVLKLPQKEVITNADSLKIGDNIEVILHKGKIQSEVKKIEN